MTFRGNYSVAGALEVHEARADQVTSIAGGVFEEVIFFNLLGVGEAVTPVTFSVRFLEHPTLSTGWEMFPNQNLVPGKFPIVSIGVLTWASGKAPTHGQRFYDGCTFITKTQGPQNLHIAAHCTLRGLAINNPAGF